MPGRSKRMRYVYADESRLARSQQPVYAWKRSWVTPEPSGETYKIYKWVKTGQTVIHEDEDGVAQDSVPVSATTESENAQVSETETKAEQSPADAAAAAADAEADIVGSDTPATGSNLAQSVSPAVSTPKPVSEQQSFADLNGPSNGAAPAVEHIPVEVEPASSQQPELPATIEANIDMADKPEPPQTQSS
ncbi:hypothetical protein LPJ79_004406 [Coemansia sp. RSA 1821]|nr:hypothetical protein LPJ68_004039 [Coemansia sp. RSA 1086]KAJ1748566.1 hypothetical protein LPJ79_004406 [Coemansia sp. RSA 1821]